MPEKSCSSTPEEEEWACMKHDDRTFNPSHLKGRYVPFNAVAVYCKPQGVCTQCVCTCVLECGGWAYLHLCECVRIGASWRCACVSLKCVCILWCGTKSESYSTSASLGHTNTHGHGHTHTHICVCFSLSRTSRRPPTTYLSLISSTVPWFTLLSDSEAAVSLLA